MKPDMKDNWENGQDIKPGDICPACKQGRVVVHTYNNGEGWAVECDTCHELFDED